MDISSRIKNLLIRPDRVRNDAGSQTLGSDFLRYGSRRNGAMFEDWSSVQMSDLEFYSGYSYAAINNRANKVSQLAIGNLKTTATKKIQDDARKKDVTIVHPYLDIIDKSNDFTNSAFWYDISTYLDLEGVYYLMAVRAVAPGLVGEIQYFKMLNPYDIRRVRNKETMEIGGYIETRDGLTREIPKEMIIEMRKLNPFSKDKNFAMTDAAKDSQFTIKQASDYARSSLKHGVNSPGIISTDIIMEDELFANFKARVTSQDKGAPLFGNGAGTISWTPMNVDLDKAALTDINSINRDTLFAVSGVSKTTMGIEESGTTREVSRTQKDKFMEDHIIPQTQLIIDAMNQDYKVYYPDQYKQNNYTIVIDSPMAADKDAELMDVQIAQESYALYTELVDAGYDRTIAARYSEGYISLAELGEPTNDPKPVVVPPAAGTPPVATPPVTPTSKKAGEPTKPVRKKTLTKKGDTPPSKKKQSLESTDHHTHEELSEEELKVAINELGSTVANNVSAQEASLQNAVTNVEGQIVSGFLNKLTKAHNSFDSNAEVATKVEKRQYVNELALAFAAYYLILWPIYGNSLMRKRAAEYGTFVAFALDAQMKKQIESISQNAAESHFNTIAKDILTVAKKVEQEASERELAKLLAAGAEETDEVIKLARTKALEGAGREEIISAIQTRFAEMSVTRAKTIARNEASRAFTQSQFQADLQFLHSTGLMEKAYKKWDAPNPDACNYCKSLASEPPIPFTQNFVDLGGVVTATETRSDGVTVVKKLPVNYEPLSAGNAHVNCYCRYILIIK